MAVISRNIYGERYGRLRRLEHTGAQHEIEPLGGVGLEFATELVCEVEPFQQLREAGVASERLKERLDR
jgi:hypothetical protein